MTLDELRIAIDSIDNEIAPLLARRMDLAAQVAGAKRESGAPILQPAREQAILERLSGQVDAQYQPALQAVYEAILRASRAYQEECQQLKVLP